MADVDIDLKKLGSVEFDYALDNIKGKCDKCSLCYSNFNNLKNPFSFQLLCLRLVKNIEYTHSTIEINGMPLKEKRCDDFIYWMHNNVIKMNEKADQDEINKIINELKKIWGSVNDKLISEGKEKLHMCDITKIKTPENFEELKQKKIMSDYCQNFEFLRTKLTMNKYDCNIYYDYFIKTKDIYNDIFEKCHKPGSDKTNCPYLCKDNKHDPKQIISKLNCDNIPEEKEKPNLITQEQCNTETDKLRSELGKALLDTSNPAFNFSDPRAILLILFTFWGIFLTFLFLYKLTPFASLLRNNLLKKKIVRDNLDEQAVDESIYDYSDNVNTNMQNIGYNISYNSDWNLSG
ncbi:PIR Superfamily Protein [Plasmodium ovale curtisi]|uniref:PIR Superfamily Protein n=1 Tax=Plasmodium ovale curtisi TaxID=864141 RepID=A0A1A8WR44_PLAOA|nr:PIR Superfamily Protein [Plasmodium ovale curtisi]